MGYWSTTPSGESFADDDTHVWGDQPADIMDNALDEIRKIFQFDVGRPPTDTELLAGFLFSAQMEVPVSVATTLRKDKYRGRAE